MHTARDGPQPSQGAHSSRRGQARACALLTAARSLHMAVVEASAPLVTVARNIFIQPPFSSPLNRKRKQHAQLINYIYLKKEVLEPHAGNLLGSFSNPWPPFFGFVSLSVIAVDARCYQRKPPKRLI